MTKGSDRPLVGVGVVVIDDKGRLLLIQRGHEPQKGLWAIPGGKVEFGETMKAAARREVIEETGLDVDIGEVVWVGEVIEDTHHLVLIDFAGSQTGGVLSAADDAVDVRWVPLDEVTDYPLTPTMYDLVDTLRL
ncbi:MAG TPA: NUDIX hydrolase [Acidimicrobiia bacterium]|nr:NUDIX hydrolase [Acidimicrobiia bacterium]